MPTLLIIEAILIKMSNITNVFTKYVYLYVYACACVCAHFLSLLILVVFSLYSIESHAQPKPRRLKDMDMNIFFEMTSSPPAKTSTKPKQTSPSAESKQVAEELNSARELFGESDSDSDWEDLEGSQI